MLLGLGSGEWILVFYWIGRVVPMWTVPTVLMRGTGDGNEIARELLGAKEAFRDVAICGLAIAAVSCALSITIASTWF